MRSVYVRVVKLLSAFAGRFSLISELILTSPFVLTKMTTNFIFSPPPKSFGLCLVLLPKGMPQVRRTFCGGTGAW